MKKIFKIMLFLSVITIFQGCVGKIVAAPFKVTGAILNTVTPDIVGDTVSGVGEVADTIIPF